MTAQRVQTVLGPVPPDELGRVDAHDHVLISGGPGVAANCDLGISDRSRATSEVAQFRNSGGGTMVDAMPLDCGRDPEGLVEVARATGVHLIATTGFHLPKYYDDLHWSFRYDINTVIELLVAETLEGMDRHSYSGPVINRLDARPGLVKWATDYGRMLTVSRRLGEAVAECHRATGIPVITHTDHGTLLHEQLDHLEAHGAPPSAVLLSHVDRNADLRLLTEVAGRGAFLIFDGPSRVKYHPVQTVIDLIAGLFEAGLGGQVLVGLDHALRSQQSSYGGGPGSAFLLQNFVPRLASVIGTAGQHQVTMENPARALVFRTCP